MSRKGDCFDSAPMESFFKTLKTELVHQSEYATRAEARRDVFTFLASTASHPNTHLAMSLKTAGGPDSEAIPRGGLDSSAPG
jgi:putative transposase